MSTLHMFKFDMNLTGSSGKVMAHADNISPLISPPYNV